MTKWFVCNPSFPMQVASCTLDASAKIYAGRVDSIHADTYKMLGGLGHGDRQNKGKLQKRFS